MKEINEDELKFVAHHYEEDALDADRAWRRFQQRAGIPLTRRTTFRRIAASVGILFIVSASIACGFWYARRQAVLLDTPEQMPTATATTPYRYLQPTDESLVLKYDNAPIGDVLSELTAYYGRELVLKGEADRRISGEIEATSLEEVVEILNATLDVEIVIKAQN